MNLEPVVKLNTVYVGRCLFEKCLLNSLTAIIAFHVILILNSLTAIIALQVILIYSSSVNVKPHYQMYGQAWD